MADAMVSAVADRLIALLEEQARYHINLVRGAEEMVRRLAVDLQNVRNVLDDAEIRRFKDKSINYWLSRLEQISYDMDDILDEWDYALLKFQISEAEDAAPPKQKVCSFIPSSSCLCFNKVAVRHSIGKKILDVKEKLDEILKERDLYGFSVFEPSGDHPLAAWRDQSTSMIDLDEVHGRDQDRNDLVTKIMGNCGGQEKSCFRVLSIVGTGGLGKTTLAQMVYNDNQVMESFELRIWVCVSDSFDLAVVAKRILESIKVGSSPNTDSLDVLFKQVKDSISGRKFLLVLDDVWTEDPNKWKSLENSLRSGGDGSKILVTSRSKRVVKVMGSRKSDICRPGFLSDDDSWLLLCRVALQGKNDVAFEDIGKKIAKKCKGLPLAVKTLGSLLRFKRTLEQWKSILNSEIWQMEKAEIDIFPHLLLSYNELSPTLKRCFSYCAFFPKDTRIDVGELIQNWMALGYLGSNVDNMELEGRNYFDVLATHSLFQDFEKGDSGEIEYCKMHDIVHDFAQYLKNKGKVEAPGMNRCTVCNPSHVSMVRDYGTLYGREVLPNICDCIVRMRVFAFEYYSYRGIPRGMKNVVHLRRLILSGTGKLSHEDLKIIFQLYYLQSLSLSNCGLEEIPEEIDNLIYLRFLNLSQNELLKELPIKIGNLVHLRYLDLWRNKSLKELPESLCNLQNLQTLNNVECDGLRKIPERLVNKLSEIPMGIGGIKLKSRSKNLKGSLKLYIRIDGDLNEVVEDARKAELRNEMHITNFDIHFQNEMGEEGSSSLWMDVMEALEPHPNLSKLCIQHFGGSKFPQWMVSPLNQLRDLNLSHCNQLTSLLPFGKLPYLEHILISFVEALKIVGRELLGMTKGEGDVIVFPNLKHLEFHFNKNWLEWEDIMEEEAKDFVIMPYLTHLAIVGCEGLKMLPHRLLGKVSSLKTLNISYSTMLQQRYADKDGSDWKSISINNPGLHLISRF